MTSRAHESESEVSYDGSENGASSIHSQPPANNNNAISFISTHRRTGSEGMPASPSVSSSHSPIGVPPLPPPRGKTKKRVSRRTEWDILEGLKEGQTFDREPKKFEGFVLKKRKWPLKGYHKRYYVLDKGIIMYGKSGWDIARGKIHGSVDAGLSVITTRPRDGRVDIDAEDSIYHLKIKPKEVYCEWIEQLKQHRLFRQNTLLFKDLSATAADDLGSPLHQPSESRDPRSGIEKELLLVEKDLSHLQQIVDSIPQPKKDEDNKLKDFLILAKEVVVSLRGISRSVGSGINAREVEGGAATLRHALNQALQQNSEFKSRLNRIHRESTIDLSYTSMNAMALSMSGATSDTIKSYGSTVSNSEYYDALDFPEKPETVVDDDRTSSDEGSFSSEDEGEADSINSEVSEPPKFEHDTGIRPSISTLPCNANTIVVDPNGSLSTVDSVSESYLNHGRRAQLPYPAPSGSEAPSLWGILKKNIGKDLSRVSMPVTLNEPLGVLQRMCEELEYSDLLDTACKEPDPLERMALVAAFAVSGYSSAFWRTHKPFNPLLGETYECLREDKGFRYIAEQVSHHPPVSAAHAEGRGWMFWEETQPKTKFWGKSMEIQSLGEVHIVFPKFGEHYSYNRATTCVHNLFSPASRWVDLYGEVAVKAGNLTANLTFMKASYWSARKYEVFGNIVNKDGMTLRNLFGKSNEAFYVGEPPTAKCLWRMGAMPEDHARYYGFTRFAIELNELSAQLRGKIPINDTRFRPDQRLLEEGNLNGAETMKLTIEQKQRDRRKKREELNMPFTPMWFQKSSSNSQNGEEQWEFNGSYWEARKAGFKTVVLEPLW